MSQITIAQAMQMAVGHYQAGRFGEAESVCRQILSVSPDFPGSLHLLGVIAGRRGHNSVGVELIRRAIAAAPATTIYYCNLATLLSGEGKFDEAIQCCQDGLARRPGDAEIVNQLGAALGQAGRVDEAIGAFQRALVLKPDFAQAHYNLGVTLEKAGRLDDAIASQQSAVSLKPEYAEAHYNLGWAWQKKGRFADAIACYERAVAFKPDLAVAHNNLAAAFNELGDTERAIACCRRAIGIQADYAEANYNLGISLRARGELDEAVAALRRALSLLPGSADIQFELSDALMINGQFDEAMTVYGRGVGEESKRHAPEVVARPGEAKVVAVCSIRNGRVDLLPHWLEHYSKLGVDQILIGLFDDLTADVREQIEACSARWRFTCFKQRWAGTSEASHEEQRSQGCRQAGVTEKTWVMHTDLDEFHEFPASVHEIIAAAESQGMNAISGWFLDRVAADGTLAPIRPAPSSLFEQFPIGCRLTARILHGGTQKIMMAHFDVPMSSGHHCSSAAKPGSIPLGRPEQYVVHHFKWHAELVPRLQWSSSQPSTNARWRREAVRFLEWLESNGGRIKLDEDINARSCLLRPAISDVVEGKL